MGCAINYKIFLLNGRCSPARISARAKVRCSAAIKAEGELFCIFLVQVVNPPVFYETSPSKEARLLSRLNIEAQTLQLPARKSDLPIISAARLPVYAARAPPIELCAST
jgi:hypothetical protein